MIAVGADVGESFLDVAVHGEPKVQQFNNTNAGIRQLVKQLSKRGEVRIVAEATGGYEELLLEICSVPVAHFTVSMLWHPRLDADPAHRWMRSQIRDICATT